MKLAAPTTVAPANDNVRPRWVALPEEARQRGLSTEALRRWCERHKVPIRQANHRDAWVQPSAIDAAVEGFPVAGAPSRDELDDILDRVPSARR